IYVGQDVDNTCHHKLGRLASIVVKQLLTGKGVMVFIAEKKLPE
ncbi:hypothetical protein SOVF_182940, partial [Spinacia oleracea]